MIVLHIKYIPTILFRERAWLSFSFGFAAPLAPVISGLWTVLYFNSFILIQAYHISTKGNPPCHTV